MIRIKAKAEYPGQRKALWAALSYFANKKDIPTIKIEIAYPESYKEYRFSRKALELQLDMVIYSNMSKLIIESLPGKAGECRLYHKSDILNIFNNGLV